MKSFYLLPLFLVLSISSFGQKTSRIQKASLKNLALKTTAQQTAKAVYYEQDFEGYTEGDMTFIDNDGLTPHSSVEKYGSNWSVIEGVAYSSSYLTDGNKTSDNWMISPKISLGSNTLLLWNATSYDANYRDGYEIFVSTSGNSISDFTTSLYSIAEENYGWTKRFLDLSAYDGQDVYIAFHHNSTDKFVLGIDNIVVGQMGGFDISLTSTDHKKYLNPHEKTSVNFTVENLLIDTLETATLNYQINNLSVQSYNIDSTLTYGQKATFSHTDSIELADAGSYNLKVWISNLNGSTDDNSSNDTAESHFYVIASDFQKNVLLEEYTGAWCGWCPGGAVEMEKLLLEHENLIGICAHAGDTMQIDETIEVTTALKTFYPGGSVDRYKPIGADLILSREKWGEKITERLEMAVPAKVDFTYTYNKSTREITVNASTEFALSMSEEFRFNCYVIEDNVTKDDPKFDQNNYYSGNAQFKDHPYYNKPNPVTDYIHKHVVREMLGGSWGAEGSVPSNVVAGETYSHQFKYTLSNDYDPNQLYFVVTLQEYNEDVNKREILNAKQLKFSDNSIQLIQKDGSYIFDNDTVEVSGNASDSEIEYALSVRNNSVTTTTINAKKTILEAIDGATNTFCWGGSCYPNEITTSTGTTAIPSGDMNTDFRADLSPSGNSGIQKIKYTFFNVDNFKEEVSVLVFFNVEKASGIHLQKEGAHSVKYWPNPINSSNILNIDYSAMDDSPRLIKMYDNTSRLIFVEQIEENLDGRAEINLGQHNLSAGTYYLLLNSKNTTEAIKIVVVK